MLSTNSAENAIKRKLRGLWENIKVLQYILHLPLSLKRMRRSFSMSSCQNKAEPTQNLKSKAKICAVTWTIIYVLLLPLLSYFALLSAMVFDKPDLSILKGLSIVFIISLIPLSLPISIDLMWSSYVSEEYDRTLFFWSVPWLTLISVLALDFIISSWM